VTLNDNRQFKATVIGTYPEADLAVLDIEAEGLPTLELANSDVADIGEWVLAVGNPFNLTSTVTAGIISAKGRSIDAIRSRQANGIESFIQTDAAVNPGNSGGALVDSEGKLLGINTAIATRTGSFAGYSFAIPINLVKRIVDDLIENGEFERVMLGVSVFEVDSDYAEEIGLDFTQGLVVSELVDGGAAQFSGVEKDDIIVAVNDRSITTFPELQEVISTMRNGDVVRLKIYRNGFYQEVEVRLKAG
ncbi:MAG: trypsin-like peptidase domain-containing protein, partial [Bacteroidota bacterium]